MLKKIDLFVTEALQNGSSVLLNGRSITNFDAVSNDSFTDWFRVEFKVTFEDANEPHSYILDIDPLSIHSTHLTFYMNTVSIPIEQR